MTKEIRYCKILRMPKHFKGALELQAKNKKVTVTDLIINLISKSCKVPLNEKDVIKVVTKKSKGGKVL
jgi:hypothetical protein